MSEGSYRNWSLLRRRAAPSSRESQTCRRRWMNKERREAVQERAGAGVILLGKKKYGERNGTKVSDMEGDRKGERGAWRRQRGCRLRIGRQGSPHPDVMKRPTW